VRQRVNIELCLSREVHVVSFVMINKADWKLNGTKMQESWAAHLHARYD
jgi:hypothetical protein